MNRETVWLAVGFLGQASFSMRFLVQWIATEKRKKSTIPVIFWYFSLAGGALLLAYAIYRRDPVFILGQSFGVFVYLRNLYFIHREKTHDPA
ncbi:MAG: lipid A biosynthesis protein [Deltaproteobacteria bacterium]|nr:MAG: lipid A biosynthesis protein [Deltaproteobacteria bacterium]